MIRKRPRPFRAAAFSLCFKTNDIRKQNNLRGGKIESVYLYLPLLDEVHQDGANQRQRGMQVLLPSDAGQGGLHGWRDFTHSSTLAGRCSSLRGRLAKMPIKFSFYGRFQ